MAETIIGGLAAGVLIALAYLFVSKVVGRG